jgi:pyrroline-5-carboxylate reductase
MKRERIGFIGAGNMASSIIKGIIEAKAFERNKIYISDKNNKRKAAKKKTFKVKAAKDNKDLVESVQIVLLCVKPQDIDQVLSQIASCVTEDKLIISIAAGVTRKYIEKFLPKNTKVIRVMPNIVSLVRESMSVLSYGKSLDSKSKKTVEYIFNCVGQTEHVEEKYMDTVTALSGSGPAYIAYLLKFLIEASVEEGLSRKEAEKLTFQTAEGVIKLIRERNIKLDELIKMVASKGGTTEAALDEFRKNKMDKIIKKAVKAASKRSKNLSRG